LLSTPVRKGHERGFPQSQEGRAKTQKRAINWVHRRALRKGQESRSVQIKKSRGKNVPKRKEIPTSRGRKRKGQYLKQKTKRLQRKKTLRPVGGGGEKKKGDPGYEKG